MHGRCHQTGRVRLRSGWEGLLGSGPGARIGTRVLRRRYRRWRLASTHRQFTQEHPSVRQGHSGVIDLARPEEHEA